MSLYIYEQLFIHSFTYGIVLINYRYAAMSHRYDKQHKVHWDVFNGTDFILVGWIEVSLTFLMKVQFSVAPNNFRFTTGITGLSWSNESVTINIKYQYISLSFFTIVITKAIIITNVIVIFSLSLNVFVDNITNSIRNERGNFFITGYCFLLWIVVQLLTL